MKLLNREPTEEMIKAAGLHYESEKYTGCISTFKAMYDAAPELKVGMEPSVYVWVCIDAESSDVRLTVERGELVNVICSALAKYKGEKHE